MWDAVQSDLCISISDGSTCLPDEKEKDEKREENFGQKFWFWRNEKEGAG